MPPKVGDAAPRFTLPATGGKKISLSEFKDKKNVILAFFALAWTGVWTTEMSAFRDEYPRLEGLNTQVLGISADSVPTLTAWARHLSVSNYPFLSDFWPHGEVTQKYGLLRAEGFPERAIVIIDSQGIIRYFNIYELKTVPVVDEIIKELEKLPQ